MSMARAFTSPKNTVVAVVALVPVVAAVAAAFVGASGEVLLLAPGL